MGDILTSMVPVVETYSIDESFLNLSDFREREVEKLARELHDRVLRWTGIPTCVGLGSTKTLAKVGNYIAKKRPAFRGVCDLRSAAACAELLATVPLGEVWGIGGASATKLAKLGVNTAADLATLEPDDARALMTVTGVRVVYELGGIVPAAGTAGADSKGNCRHAQLWGFGHGLGGDARGHRELRHASRGKDAPVQGGC